MLGKVHSRYSGETQTSGASPTFQLDLKTGMSMPDEVKNSNIRCYLVHRIGNT